MIKIYSILHLLFVFSSDLHETLACNVLSNCCCLMYDFHFSSSGRNGQVHSRPLPVSVCLSEGAGGKVLDSSERECDCSESRCF